MDGAFFQALFWHQHSIDVVINWLDLTIDSCYFKAEKARRATGWLAAWYPFKFCFISVKTSQGIRCAKMLRYINIQLFIRFRHFCLDRNEVVGTAVTLLVTCRRLKMLRARLVSSSFATDCDASRRTNVTRWIEDRFICCKNSEEVASCCA